MRIVHCKKDKYTHYIGRPRAGNPIGLGNPFTVERYGRGVCIPMFEDYARENMAVQHLIWNLPEDSILGCWCAPAPCHGDVIIKLWKEMHD